MDDDFELFFRDQYSSVVAAVRGIVCSPDLAEGVAQDAFVAGFVRWRRVRTLDKPGAWVRRVAIREAVRVAKRAVRTSPLVSDLRIQSDADSKHEPVYEALLLLPLNQRIVVALHDLDGWPTAEVADVLEIAPATVRVHLHRARRALEKTLAESTSEVTG